MSLLAAIFERFTLLIRHPLSRALWPAETGGTGAFIAASALHHIPQLFKLFLSLLAVNLLVDLELKHAQIGQDPIEQFSLRAVASRGR